MKKIITAIICMTFCISCSTIFVACNDGNKMPNDDSIHVEESGTEEPVDELSIIIEGFSFDDRNGFISVPNSQEVFTFNDIVKVNSNSIWELSLDIYGLMPIKTNTIALHEGDNYVYLLVTSKTEKSKLYTLNVRRREIYSVTFNSNAGSETIIESVEVEEDGYCVLPESPTRNGYTFSGWDYDFANPIVETFTTYAQWVPNEYIVTYNNEGGSLSSGQTSASVAFGKEYTLAVPEKPNYVFVGWFEEPNRQGLQFTNEFGDSICPWDNYGNLDFYAGWKSAYEYQSYGSNGIEITKYLGHEKNVVIPDEIDGARVYRIGDGAFANNTDIETVVMSNNVAEIGSEAFLNCNNLKMIQVSWNVNTIEQSAFEGCVSLKETRVYGSWKNWLNIEFENPTANPIYYSQALYWGYGEFEPLMDGYVHTGVIKPYAFYNCKSLFTLWFTREVESIGTDAFHGCDNLTIYYLGEY